MHGPGGTTEAGKSLTFFRSYSDETFSLTPGWQRLEHILTGDGGAYGLHGPRGSGKSWLMQRAIQQADRAGGMGLWFPCPSEYAEASEFLSALSDNLANAVEQRYIRNDLWWTATRWLQRGLALVVAVSVAAAVVSYVAHGPTVRRTNFFSVLPVDLWAAAGAAVAALCLLTVVQFVRLSRPAGRLARQATAVRERIRYNTALKQGNEVGVSAAFHLTGTFKRTREKDLDERPTTVASLVFDFRRLAEAIIAATGRRLVIGIDELDKIGDEEAARKLLRDIKGIFEIPSVFFLVSVSEEAATALQLGALQGKGRNEFNSSFYTVIEMPPLDPADVIDIAAARGQPVRPALARLLCLLSVGNVRELIRLADGWPHRRPDGSGERFSDRGLDEGDCRIARRVLAAEAGTLLREIVRACGPTADQVLPEAWKALPEDAFESPDEFAALSQSAIKNCWNLGEPDPAWQEKITESWRRFLIRLFIAGRVVPLLLGTANAGPDHSDICDLRDVLIMSGHSTPVALLMLKARFGDDLASPYTKPPGRAVLPACHLRYRGVVYARRAQGGGCCAHIRPRGERGRSAHRCERDGWRSPFSRDGPAQHVPAVPGGSHATGRLSRR
jgi:KAP family P-loop domain